MSPPLDLWDSIPHLVLARIATSVIQLARFAHAEINGGPFLFFARELISEMGAWTVVIIGNSAYARGQITFATLRRRSSSSARAIALPERHPEARDDSRDTQPRLAVRINVRAAGL
jgi:hypothetical protein